MTQLRSVVSALLGSPSEPNPSVNKTALKIFSDKEAARAIDDMLSKHGESVDVKVGNETYTVSRMKEIVIQ